MRIGMLVDMYKPHISGSARCFRDRGAPAFLER